MTQTSTLIMYINTDRWVAFERFSNDFIMFRAEGRLDKASWSWLPHATKKRWPPDRNGEISSGGDVFIVTVII